MSIVLFLQNLTQIFWSIIIALNLYVLLLLYRVSKLYRSERFGKLEATAFLRNQIECMRNQFVNSSTSELMTVNHKLPTTAVENKTKPTKNELPITSLSKKVKTPTTRSKSVERKKLTKTIKSFTEMKNASSSSSMLSNRSDDNRNNNSLMDEQHTLYISDSYGRVVQEIPFKEKDYLEALCSVLNN